VRSAALGDVAKLDRKGIAPPDIKAGTRYIGLEHIDGGTGAIAEATVLNGEIKSSKFVFTPDHVLFGKLRPNLRKTTQATFCGICSTDIVPILPGPKLDARYLMHFLRTDDAVREATNKATGVNLPRLSPKLLADFAIPLPPLAEQKRIAAILDQADALRRLRRQSIARLNTLAQSVFYEMFGDPQNNPKEFPRASLGEIIEFKGGSQPNKKHFSYEPGPDVVRLVQTRDFKTDRYVTYIPRHLAKRSFTEDDVMIGRYGPPVFQILRGLSGSYNVALMKASPKRAIEKQFVFYLLSEKRLQADVIANSQRTAGQTGVNLDFLNKYPAYQPPSDLQKKFSAASKEIETSISNMKRQLLRADDTFSSLQQRAFRGDL